MNSRSRRVVGTAALALVARVLLGTHGAKRPPSDGSANHRLACIIIPLIELSRSSPVRQGSKACAGHFRTIDERTYPVQFDLLRRDGRRRISEHYCTDLG